MSGGSVCGCPAGYAATSDGNCELCEAGKFKGLVADTNCTSCTPGTYMAGVGATACLTCAAFADADVPRVECRCNAGATGNGSVCVRCVAGKYKNTTGNDTCLDCAANTYSGTVGATGAGTCLNCPANAVSEAGSVVIAACVCKAGATGPNGGVCTLCAVGKYKAVNGTAACTDCWAGSYSGALGANTSDVCLSCPDNSSSVAGSSLITSCVCNTGASGPNGGPCALCVPGKYKTVSGTAVCTNCSANTFSTVVGATSIVACSNCGANSQSGGSSAACVCNKGYTGPDGGVCLPCVAGTFKTGIGSAECTLCANNTFSGVVGSTNASVCQSCQANAISAAGSVDQEYCYCKPGHAHLEGRHSCRQCTPGTYNSQLAQRACSNCTIGMYSLNYSAISPETCKYCPAGQWSPEGSANCNLCPAYSRTLGISGVVTDCVCDPGYIGPGGSTCVACAAGLYKDVQGPDGCVSCPALTSSFPGTVRATDCWCVSGYIKVSGVCVAMIPRPIQISGSLEGVAANASAVQIQQARAALRQSIAAQLNVAIELVQVDPVANSSTGVQVLLFARSESEVDLLQRKVALATSAPTQSALPFLLLPTGDASVGEPRTVLITVDIHFQARRRSRESEALFAVTTEMSEYFDVPVYTISYTIEESMSMETPRVRISVSTSTQDEFLRVLTAAQTLLEQGNVTLPDLTLSVVTVSDSGPSGLNFTHALVHADGSPMSGSEVQTSLQAVIRQLSWFYNVPEYDVSVVVTANASACVDFNGTETCFGEVYTVQVFVASNAMVSTQNLQVKYSVMSEIVETPEPLVLNLPFELDNIFYFTNTGVDDFYVEMELVDSDGIFLDDAQVAQADETLTWHLAEFFGVDASLVHFETIAPRYPMLNNATNVRVWIDCTEAQLPDLLLRGSQLTATATVLVQPYTLTGLANAVQNEIHGQMVDGIFVECQPNFIVNAQVCKCKPGYRLSGTSCVPCEAGTYGTELNTLECTACELATFSLGGATACTSCHENSNASTGSSSQDACQCNPGYFFFLTLLEIEDGAYNTVQNYSCLPCVNGSYKNESGNFNCSVCEVSDYSLDTLSCDACNYGYGRIGSNDSNTSACVSCPPGSFTAAPGNGACVDCPADTFSNVSTVSACETCPLGYRSLPGTIELEDCCALNSAPEQSDTLLCLCNAGYTGPDAGEAKGQCNACPPGTYKDSNGAANCTRCSVGMYSPTLAADGNTTCAVCAAGQYAPEASANCTVCPANSAAPAGSGLVTNCLCNMGYTGPNGGPCVSCLAGTYKDSNGTANCTRCPLNSNSSAASVNITDCFCDAWCYGPDGGPCIPNNSTLNLSSGVYQCSPGFTGPDATGPCVACALGKYKNVSGSAACSNCAPGQYQDAVAATGCSSCAPDSFSNASGAPLCTQCPAGFKSLSATTTGEDCCGLNSFPQKITTSTITNQDPLSSVLATSPAYIMTSAEAWDSVNSRFTDLSGNGRHGALTGGTVSVGSVTGNGAGRSIPYVQGTSATSISWPAASIPTTFTICSITRYSGGTRNRILQCSTSDVNWLHGHWSERAGATWYHGFGEVYYSISPNTDWVVVCGRNIETEGSASVIANGVVTCTACGGIGNCPLGINGGSFAKGDWMFSRLYIWNRHLSNTEFADASAKLNSYVAGVQPLNSGLWSGIGCPCNAGYTGPVTGASKGQCAICPPGTYKDSNGTANCTSCPLNSNSSAGSQNITDCVCDAWCDGPRGGPCIPKNSTFNVTSGVYQCSPGYTGPDRTGPCLACLLGKYKNVPGPDACTNCANGTYQDGLAATACWSCAPDTFSNASGAESCTQCPAGFKSLSATTTVQDCCGLNSFPQKISTCTITKQDPLSSILATSPAYLMASAEAWDAANSRFTDLSGNGRHGFLNWGTVSVGSVAGNGAGLPIPYVEGTTQTAISWPSASIPPTFTICSITRYSGSWRQRILQCSNLNWLHGHWNGNAGVTHYYGQAATEHYSSNPKTNWAVLCGRNIWTAGSAGVISNGVVTCTACGGVGNCDLGINRINYEQGDWQLSRLYVWDRHLSNAEFAEASTKLNSYVAGELKNCVSSISCSCNTGYTGPDTGVSKGQCSMCAVGTYKDASGSAACTLCPANSNSSVNSDRISNCSCNPRYTGPNGGPCVACEAGKFKNASGPAACDVCPANTYSASGAFGCLSCPAGFQSAPGSREVADCCDPNTTLVTNLFYSLSSATQAQLSATYVVLVSSSPTVGGVATPGSSRPTYIAVDGFNGQPFLRFSKTSSTTGPHQFLYVSAGGVYVGSGVTIVTVVRFTENMRGMLLSMQQGNEFIGFEVSRSNGLQFCVCALTGGNGCNNLCTDAAVPTNVWLQVSYTFNPSITNKQLLKVSYTLSDGSTAVLLKTSTVHISSMTTARKTHGFGYSASTDCSGSSFFVQRTENLPMCDRSNFDLAGFYLIQTLMSDADVTVLFQAIASGSQIAFDRSTTCPCNAGFGGTGRSDCKSCAVGTYKSEVKSVSCSLCAANTYSTAVQATNVSTCLSCPSNSVSVAGRFECECDFGYEGGMFECVACVPGKFKRFLGTSACVDCPANTEATGIASKVCASLPGYNGLGYALEDVARACGGSLSGTCKTLSNGATSNAAGGADGALDGSVSTSVSVTFGQNLARSCGNTGTTACATTTGSVYRPWWGVDFGRSRSVFAVSVMSTNWASTKDFKVVVGDVADAQSPLNAVCADYLVGSGSGYVKFTCEDTVSGRYLYIVNGPHAANSLILSDVTVDAFNYAANASLMLPWWAVDFEAERAVSGLVIQAQTASVIQVRVGHSTDPLQNAVCKDNVTIATAASNTVNCSSAMLGRYIFVIGAGNKVLVLNDVRVLGASTAQCAAGTYKPLVGNHNCTACAALSTSVIGATSVLQCSCRAGYLNGWS